MVTVVIYGNCYLVRAFRNLQNHCLIQHCFYIQNHIKHYDTIYRSGSIYSTTSKTFFCGSIYSTSTIIRTGSIYTQNWFYIQYHFYIVAPHQGHFLVSLNIVSTATIYSITSHHTKPSIRLADVMLYIVAVLC